ncbi:MAG TPA: heavy metal translocating P-type ATPase metal-binding domain-containing protein, partial [Gammaproteobacteria bacterium]
MSAAAPTTPAASCFHCGLALTEEWPARVAGSQRSFCCPGCRAVCLAIHEAGLEAFYPRARDAGALAPPPAAEDDFAVYDLDEVQAGCVRWVGSEREAELLVEGIHCAACVWLIERRLERLPGVVGAQVNLAARRLHLRWDPARLALSDLLRALAAIGYVAIPFDAEAAEGRLLREQRARLYRLAFAGFAMMNLLWISIALYSGADQGEHRALLHWAGWALATPTLLYAGWPFLHGALAGLRRGYLTMDLPIAIGAGATWGYSTWAMLYGSAATEVYFDTVVNFLFVILVGRHLEALSRRQALSSTYRLMELQPKVATLVEAGGERSVAVRALRPGQQVRVRPGGQVPVDGRVLDGTTSVDEALLSGESAPRAKGPGDRVYAGTLNLDGSIVLAVEQVLGDTALGRIVRLVETAQASKAPVQRLADRIVPWFVAVTLGLAGLTLAGWLAFGGGGEPALMAAVAVLIVTCPCAFGMATPMAIAVAAGVGARHGVLVKSGAALEALAGAGRVVFDKTGT